MTREEDMQQEQQTEENYVEGCHEENYMVPHVCPVATGGWCKDYVKCRSIDNDLVPLLSSRTNLAL